MKTITLATALTCLLTLTACEASTMGADLCASANVEAACGIAVEACQQALQADDSFRVEHAFTNWRLQLKDDDAGSPRCVLSAHDTGSGDAIDFGPSDPRDIDIDVGEAVAPGNLLDEPDQTQIDDVA